MVEEMEKIAGLLETSNLEQDTVALINVTIREQLEEYRKRLREPTPQGQHPFTPDIFKEWLEGQGKEGG